MNASPWVSEMTQVPSAVPGWEGLRRPLPGTGGETALVKDARARGHRAMDGLTMLVEQGALSFERWFGVAPDRAAMWEAVKAVR